MNHRTHALVAEIRRPGPSGRKMAIKKLLSLSVDEYDTTPRSRQNRQPRQRQRTWRASERSFARPGAGALIVQTMLMVLTVRTWEFFTYVRGIEPRSAQLSGLRLPKCARPQRSSPSPTPDHVETLISCRYFSLSQEEGPQGASPRCSK